MQMKPTLLSRLARVATGKTGVLSGVMRIFSIKFDLCCLLRDMMVTGARVALRIAKFDKRIFLNL